MEQKTRGLFDTILRLVTGTFPLLLRVAADIFGTRISARQEHDQETEQERKESEKLDPIVFAGLLSSIITIASALRDTGQRVDAPTLVVRFMEKRAQAGSVESTMPVAMQDVGNVAEFIASIHITDQKFLDRINNTCLKIFHDVVDDYSKPPIEAHQSYDVARVCVCTNIKIVQKMNGGKVPPAFRELWDRFGCGMM